MQKIMETEMRKAMFGLLAGTCKPNDLPFYGFYLITD